MEIRRPPRPRTDQRTAEHRVRGSSPFLHEDDKAILGTLQADRDERFGEDSEEMREVDRFARGLTVLRLAGSLIDQDYRRERNRQKGKSLRAPDPVKEAAVQCREEKRLTTSNDVEQT